MSALTIEQIEELERLLAESPEPWRIEREPHDYPDGTDHFSHVVFTASDLEGEPMKVLVSQYATEELAALLVGLKEYAPALLAAAKAHLTDPQHDEDAVVERIWRLIAVKMATGAFFRAFDVERALMILGAIKPGDRLPGGLIVVPEEPTEAMVDTTMRAWMEAAPKGYVKRRVPSVARTLYRAMLAASGD